MKKLNLLSKFNYMTFLALGLTAMYGCQKDRMSYANYVPTETSPFKIGVGQTAPYRLNISGKWKCVSFIRKEYDDATMTTPANPFPYQLVNSFTSWDFSTVSNVVTIKRVNGTTYGTSSYSYSSTQDSTAIIRAYINNGNQSLPDVEYKTVEIGLNNIQFTTTKPYKFITVDGTRPGRVIYAYDTFQLVREEQ